MASSSDVDEAVLEEVELPFIFFKYRSDTGDGTPLKNKLEGERPIVITDDVAELVDAYI
jgi:hypothetical protein